MSDDYKLPRSPLRVGAIAFGVTLLVGLVAGIVAIVVVNPGGDMNKRGQLLGSGVAPLAFIVGGIAYAIQRKRTSGPP